jgi:hypothetical protein
MLSALTEDLRLFRFQRKGLELLYYAQDNRDLQVCVGEGNIDSQLVPSQKSSETINVLTHIP